MWQTSSVSNGVTSLNQSRSTAATSSRQIFRCEGLRSLGGGARRLGMIGPSADTSMAPPFRSWPHLAPKRGNRATAELPLRNSKSTAPDVHARSQDPHGGRAYTRRPREILAHHGSSSDAAVLRRLTRASFFAYIVARRVSPVCLCRLRFPRAMLDDAPHAAQSARAAPLTGWRAIPATRSRRRAKLSTSISRILVALWGPLGHSALVAPFVATFGALCPNLHRLYQAPLNRAKLARNNILR